MTPQRLNEWRIVPRILILCYCYIFYDTTLWFMGLQDPTNAQAAFVSTIVGASAAFFGLYVNSGSKNATN